MHFFLQSRMRNDQLAPCKPEMGPQIIDELADPFAKGLAGLLKFRDRQIESMGQLDLPPFQPLVELEVVIANNASPGAFIAHSHNKSQAIHISRTAVGDVANEQGNAAIRVPRPDEIFRAGREWINLVTEFLK